MDPPRERDVYRARGAYPTLLIFDASEARAAEENWERRIDVRASLILSAVRGLTRPDAPVVALPRYPLPRREADAVKELMLSLGRTRFTSTFSSAPFLHRRWRPCRSASSTSARARPLMRDQLLVCGRTSLAPKKPRAQPPS
jgi:hypothetical protein